jgi:hypothetical protein
MYKVKTTNNIYESIGYDYPGEEAIKLMSDEEKKEVYLEGVIKMTHAINILNCCKMDSKRTFLLWTLIAFKNNFIVFLNELGMTTLEIEERLKLEREKNKVKQK